MNKLSHWASKAIETLKTCKDISKLGMLPDSEYSIHIANSSNYRLRIKGLVCLFKLGCRSMFPYQQNRQNELLNMALWRTNGRDATKMLP